MISIFHTRDATGNLLDFGISFFQRLQCLRCDHWCPRSQQWFWVLPEHVHCTRIHCMSSLVLTVKYVFDFLSLWVPPFWYKKTLWIEIPLITIRKTRRWCFAFQPTHYGILQNHKWLPIGYSTLTLISGLYSTPHYITISLTFCTDTQSIISFTGIYLHH